jgi:hypothetical protein
MIVVSFSCQAGEHEKCPGHCGEKFKKCQCHCHERSEEMSTVAKEWNMRCPECGKDDRIEIQAAVWVLLRPDGTDMTDVRDGSHEWGQYDNAQCVNCDYRGRVKDFEITEQVSKQQLMDDLARAIDDIKYLAPETFDNEEYERKFKENLHGLEMLLADVRKKREGGAS